MDRLDEYLTREDTEDEEIEKPRRQWTPAHRVQFHAIGLLNAIVNYVRTLDISPIRNVTPHEAEEQE
jgi:hypothetical protein